MQFKTSSKYITIEEAMEWIDENRKEFGRYKRLEDYFLGRHDILNRHIEDPSKPNNKIICNLPSFAVGIRTGYFSGEPLTVTSEDENDGKLQMILLLGLEGSSM